MTQKFKINNLFKQLFTIETLTQSKIITNFVHNGGRSRRYNNVMFY